MMAKNDNGGYLHALRLDHDDIKRMTNARYPAYIPKKKEPRGRKRKEPPRNDRLERVLSPELFKEWIAYDAKGRGRGNTRLERIIAFLIAIARWSGREIHRRVGIPRSQIRTLLALVRKMDDVPLHEISFMTTPKSRKGI